MTSKILVFLLLVCSTSCQQQLQEEDDGSYSPEKYEKPYENLVDVNPPDLTTPSPNQFSSGFPQPQQIQTFQQQQQPNLFFQPQQNSPPAQPAPQSPNLPVQNPFPQNPFFQQFRNSESQNRPPVFPQQNQPFQPQNPAPQNNPFFQQQNPQFQSQQEPRFSSPPRDTPPVRQFIDGGQPVTSTNFQTEDGIQRSETIDSEGNVKGQYSYVDPNGKTITVRYTAGKDGFKVEGDNIPQAPEPLPQVETQPQPQLPPKQPLQFRQPQGAPIPQQFNGVRSQFDLPRARFNNPPAPPPQQFFDRPEQPSPPRSRFVNGIYQPSFQLSQFNEGNKASFDFQNQNRDYEPFQSRFQ